MSQNNSRAASAPVSGKGRIWLNSFIMAAASSCGYLLVALTGGHETMWTVIGTAGIAVVLTPVFYLLNVRRARAGNAPRRRS